MTQSPVKMNLTSRAAAEVEALHRFFQNWFVGHETKSQDAFSRVSRVWPAPFTLITPTGELRSAEELLEATFAQHGSFPGLQIQIKNLRVCATLNPSVAVVIYEEWHIDPLETEARLCSATLIESETAPGGLQWVHIHESTLPRASGVAAPAA